MRTLLAILLLSFTAQAQGLYLVLTPAQHDAVQTYINNANGWPDGRGTDRYSLPFAFSDFSNCPAPLQNKVGLVFDKALIRHIANAVEGETKKDKLVRVVGVIRSNLANPTMVRVVPEGGEIEGPQTATFTDVTVQVATHLRDLVD